MRVEILQLFATKRTEYGLDGSQVYYGVCGSNGIFYVVVKNWGPEKASYQYGGALSYEVIGSYFGGWVGCGGAKVIEPNGWFAIKPSDFVRETEMEKTPLAATTFVVATLSAKTLEAVPSSPPTPAETPAPIP